MLGWQGIALTMHNLDNPCLDTCDTQPGRSYVAWYAYQQTQAYVPSDNNSRLYVVTVEGNVLCLRGNK